MMLAEVAVVVQRLGLSEYCCQLGQLLAAQAFTQCLVFRYCGQEGAFQQRLHIQACAAAYYRLFLPAANIGERGPAVAQVLV